MSFSYSISAHPGPKEPEVPLSQPLGEAPDWQIRPRRPLGAVVLAVDVAEGRDRLLTVNVDVDGDVDGDVDRHLLLLLGRLLGLLHLLLLLSSCLTLYQ